MTGMTKRVEGRVSDKRTPSEQSFGAELARFRKRLRLSQRELGDRLLPEYDPDDAKNLIGKYERGTRLPQSSDLLERLREIELARVGELRTERLRKKAEELRRTADRWRGKQEVAHLADELTNAAEGLSRRAEQVHPNTLGIELGMGCELGGDEVKWLPRGFLALRKAFEDAQEQRAPLSRSGACWHDPGGFEAVIKGPRGVRIHIKVLSNGKAGIGLPDPSWQVKFTRGGPLESYTLELEEPRK